MKSIFILGAGSTGSNIAHLLVKSGIKNLTIADRDIVEKHNLERQFYFENQIMRPKVEALKENLLKIDKNAKINIYFRDFEQIKKEINFEEFDVLIDCTDNIYSRMVLNDVSVKFGIPLLHTAAIKDEGRAALFVKACFACYFKVPKDRLDSCDTEGVSSEAIEKVAEVAVKEIILGNSKDELFFFKDDSVKKAKITKNSSCEVCVSKKFEFLEAKSSVSSRLCGSNAVHVILNRKITDKIEVVKKNNLEFLLFPNGEAIVKGTDDENLALKELKKIVER